MISYNLLRSLVLFQGKKTNHGTKYLCSLDFTLRVKFYSISNNLTATISSQTGILANTPT